jgi:murein DD-endopeptidase MepM/ murein hydrolase activator NlpD
VNLSHRRRWALTGLTLTLLGVGLGLGQAFRDTTPPSLWVEAPARVAAGEGFELRVSADEPASYRVHYGGAAFERVEQDLVLELVAIAGDGVVRIEATDGAGNASTAERTVEGVPIAAARWKGPESLLPGAPFSARLAFDPASAEVRDPRVTVAGRAAPLVPDEGAFRVLGAVPLTTGTGEVTLEAAWRDGLGRPAASRLALPHGPLDQTVEELQLSAATLSVITPEGRELEAAALASARADPADPPRWREPFALPIEGRGTSGFARPRRYAPGGPVSFHLGEDIAAPEGTPIHATNDGVVVLAGPYPIKGGLTVIDHGAGVTSRYYHQSRILVEAGQTVTRGQPIGEVGSTGLSTGPHLHWEMRVDDVPTDPLAWVDRVWP